MSEIEPGKARPEEPAAPLAQDQVPGGAPAEPAPDGPVVALTGELHLAGAGVIRALREAGLRLRVLCLDEADELAALSLRGEGEGEGQLAAVRGSFTQPEELARWLDGAKGVIFLSPVGLAGRPWRPDTHLPDLQAVIEAAEKARVADLVYLSSVAVSKRSMARCLQEALEAERRAEKSRLSTYFFRAGPVMGSGDGLVAEASRKAEAGGPLVLLWGYGGTRVQPIDPGDLGRCMVRCFSPEPQKLKPAVYTVAGHESYSVMELLDGALQKRGRFKLKLHLPFFVLRLASSLQGSGAWKLLEKIRVLMENFEAEVNDAPRLLGPHHAMKSVAALQDELLGRA